MRSTSSFDGLSFLAALAAKSGDVVVRALASEAVWRRIAVRRSIWSADYAAGSPLQNSLWSCNELTFSRRQRTTEVLALRRLSIPSLRAVSRCYRARKWQTTQPAITGGPKARIQPNYDQSSIYGSGVTFKRPMDPHGKPASIAAAFELSLSNIALFWGITGRGTKVSCRIDRCAATNRVTQREAATNSGYHL